jgi:hypothetical protein
MSRLVIPVSHRVLWSTGDVRLWADMDLEIRDSAGNFVPETFRVDTATDVSTFPAYRARQLNLPIPLLPSAGVMHSQAGLEIRSGVLRFRIVGLDATEYLIPCFFLGDPNSPPDPARPMTWPRKLLQPFQLLGQLRFILEKDPQLGSLHGDLVVEKASAAIFYWTRDVPRSSICLFRGILPLPRWRGPALTLAPTWTDGLCSPSSDDRIATAVSATDALVATS